MSLAIMQTAVWDEEPGTNCSRRVDMLLSTLNTAAESHALRRPGGRTF
mgnify:CR=1 FL=1